MIAFGAIATALVALSTTVLAGRVGPFTSNCFDESFERRYSNLQAAGTIRIGVTAIVEPAWTRQVNAQSIQVSDWCAHDCCAVCNRCVFNFFLSFALISPDAHLSIVQRSLDVSNSLWRSAGLQFTDLQVLSSSAVAANGMLYTPENKNKMTPRWESVAAPYVRQGYVIALQMQSIKAGAQIVWLSQILPRPNYARLLSHA